MLNNNAVDQRLGFKYDILKKLTMEVMYLDKCCKIYNVSECTARPTIVHVVVPARRHLQRGAGARAAPAVAPAHALAVLARRPLAPGAPVAL